MFCITLSMMAIAGEVHAADEMAANTSIKIVFENGRTSLDGDGILAI